MKINPYILSLLVLLGVLLAACAPQVGAPQSGSPQTKRRKPRRRRLKHRKPAGSRKRFTLDRNWSIVKACAQQKCLQVKDSPDGEYRLFYDQIEGFEFEEGKEYVLTVSAEPIENPPADSSNVQYRLVEVISSTPSSAPPAGQLGLELVWPARR